MILHRGQESQLQNKQQAFKTLHEIQIHSFEERGHVQEHINTEFTQQSRIMYLKGCGYIEAYRDI